jgi:hypothetical protein
MEGEVSQTKREELLVSGSKNVKSIHDRIVKGNTLPEHMFN